jgi:predicted outer membrane repeat protein
MTDTTTGTTAETDRSGRRARTALAGGGVLSLGAALFGSLSPADAATFNVTTNADSGAGSLRQAILDANAAAGPDDITFTAGLGTITLTSEIPILDDLTITGPATISGGDATRIFYIDDAGSVTLSGLTLQDGSSGAEGGGAIYADGDTDLVIQDTTLTGNTTDDNGGAIYFSGNSFILEDSVVTGNSASYDGGGIAVHTDETYEIRISRTTFSGNSAGEYGGGLSLTHNYDVTIEDSTFSGNDAGSYGGGLHWHGHYDEGAGVVLTVVNSTFSGNSANYGGGIHLEGGGHVELLHSTITANTANDGGGGIYVQFYDGDPSTILLDHLVIAGNDAPGGVDLGGYADADNTVTLSNSLVGEGPEFTPIVDGGNNEIGVDALLGPLQDNGGPTQTHLPLDGSPAIDTGDPAFAGPPATDQRGLPRVVGAAVEKGAVELQVQVPETTTTTAPPAGPPPVVAEPTFTG